MKNIILILSVLVTLNSCYNVNESVTQVPDNLISKEKLTQILTDIQVVEAGFIVSENRNGVRDLKPQYYTAVLESHNITLVDLRQNVNYYQSSPKVMEEIYEDVLAKLSKMQSDVIADIENRERIADSLKSIQDSLNNLLPDSLKLDTIVSFSKKDTIPDYLKKKQ